MPLDPLNIIVSSTRQWNPGDEFIFFGIRNLFAEVIKDRKINWILYDRNPDLNLDGFRKRKHRERILANSFHGHDPQSIDMAVIAGTPEWFGPPMIDFYGAVKEANLPLFLLGVGYIDAPIRFSNDELHCLNKLSQVVITRDEYASRALNKAEVGHHLLPCPALFASVHDETPTQIKRIGFIIQTNQTVNQSIPRDLTDRCVKAVKKLRAEGRQVDVICHYIDEFSEFARTLSSVRYSYDASDYIDIINDYDIILSTRLHGAILANSLGRPAVLLNNDDSRCRGAASLLPFIYSCRPEDVSHQIELVADANIRELSSWKAEIKEKYLDLLKEACRGLHQRFEDSSQSHRNHTSTLPMMKITSTCRPQFRFSYARATMKSFWPMAKLKMKAASGIIGKPLQELLVSAWVVLSRQWFRSSFHIKHYMLRALASSGYPVKLNVYHSGHLGDIIYSLHFLNHYYYKIIKMHINFYLNDFIPAPRSSNKNNDVSANDVLALLRDFLLTQPYIDSVQKYDGRSIHVNLDLFRKSKNLINEHLITNYYDIFGVDLPKNWNETPWISNIKILELSGEKICIFNRTVRYRNENMNWNKLYEELKKDYDSFYFVGLKNEYENFINETGISISFVETENVLELVKIIQNCRLFAGSQSLSLAIALGLGKKCIIEGDKQWYKTVWLENNRDELIL